MIRTPALISAVAALLVAPLPSASARPGDLDRTFGRLGVAGLDQPLQFSSGSPVTSVDVADIAADRGGRTVAGGSVHRSDEARLGPAIDVAIVVRYHADGRPDRTFSDGAAAVLLREGRVLSVAIDPARRVLAAGTYTASGSTTLFQARLLPTGERDASYGSGGIVTAPAIPGSVNAVVQRGGGFYFAGSYAGSGDERRALVGKVRADGSFDPGFGDGGVTILRRDGTFETLNALALTADGGVVGAGSTDAPPAGSGLLLVRLDPQGRPDPSFGPGGSVVHQFRMPDGRAATRNDGEAAWPLAGGHVLVSATASSAFSPAVPVESTRARPVLARFTATGDLDTSFGDQGRTMLSTPPVDAYAIPGALLVDHRGRVITLARVGPQTAIVRWRPGGTPDETFGRRGIATRPLLNPGAIAPVANDRLLIGVGDPGDCGFGMTLARIDGASEPDVRIVRKSIGVRRGRLELTLRGPANRTRGSVTAYLERPVRKQPPYGNGYCPKRQQIARAGFRMRRAARVSVAITRSERRSLRRRQVLLVAHSRARGRRGGSALVWSAR